MALAILVVAGAVAADCCCCGPGVRSPGYWKNHPEAWPCDTICVGGIEYTKAEAIAILETPGKGDKSYTLFSALLAAKLNACAGNCTWCIEGTLCAANEWSGEYPPGSGVTGSSCAWKEGEPLYLCLDAYNNGYLCAPSAD
jgi:hypothetical protein